MMRHLVTGTDIRERGFEWAYADTARKALRSLQPLLVNTDVTGGPGVHWVTLV